MKKLIADIWLGLRTAPVRAALAFMSLLVGLFAMTVLLATLDALRLQARSLIHQFGAGTIALLPGTAAGSDWSRLHVEALRANLADTATVAGIRILPAAPGDIPVVAADAEWFAAARTPIAQGRPLDAADITRAQRHAVVPSALARQHQWQLGQTINLAGREPFRLIGITAAAPAALPQLPAGAIYIPHTAAPPETGTADDSRRINGILLRARENVSPETLHHRLTTILRQLPPHLRTAHWSTPDTLLADIRHWQRTIAWTVGSGALLALLMGAATLSGLLLGGVRERIAEIGLRRSLGARQLDIAALFITESLALAAAAALLGVAAAELLLRAAAAHFPLQAHFGAPARLLPIAVAVILALTCSALPALKAARLPPAETLRND